VVLSQGHRESQIVRPTRRLYGERFLKELAAVLFDPGLLIVLTVLCVQ